MGRLLTIDEAATHLAVSPRTVRRLIDEGRVPRVVLRTLTRLRVEDLDALPSEVVTAAVDDDEVAS